MTEKNQTNNTKNPFPFSPKSTTKPLKKWEDCTHETTILLDFATNQRYEIYHKCKISREVT
jgi:hypothetical protein